MTRLQEALAAPASEPTSQPQEQITTDIALILAPASIFDTDRVWSELAALVEKAAGHPAIRAGLVKLLKAEVSGGRDRIADALSQNPLAAREAASSYCYLTDCVVSTIFRAVTTYLHPTPSATKSQRITLMALGGYGRGEMAPYSDVDLLFLTPYKITPWAESVIESMLYVMWDLHLKVGHASRTVKDCQRLAREDYTIRTSLLETRFLEGDQDLSNELVERLWRDVFKGTSAEFIDAKLEERLDRHKRQGGQRYVVEPNVKEGKGGLRDLQTLFWIAKYVHQV